MDERSRYDDEEDEDLDDEDEDDFNNTTSNNNNNNNTTAASLGSEQHQQRKSRKKTQKSNASTHSTRSSSSPTQSRSVSPSHYHNDSSSAAFPNLAAVAAANGIDSATALLAAQSLLAQQTPGLSFPSLAATGLLGAENQGKEGDLDLANRITLMSETAAEALVAKAAVFASDTALANGNLGLALALRVAKLALNVSLLSSWCVCGGGGSIRVFYASKIRFYFNLTSRNYPTILHDNWARVHFKARETDQ